MCSVALRAASIPLLDFRQGVVQRRASNIINPSVGGLLANDARSVAPATLRAARVALAALWILLLASVISACAGAPELVDHEAMLLDSEDEIQASLHDAWLPEHEPLRVERAAGSELSLAQRVAHDAYEERGGDSLFVEAGGALSPLGVDVVETLRRVWEHGLFVEDYRIGEIDAHLATLADARQRVEIGSELVLSEEERREVAARFALLSPWRLLEAERAALLVAALPLPRLDELRVRQAAAIEELQAVGVELEWLLMEELLHYATTVRFSNYWYWDHETLVEVGLIRPDPNGPELEEGEDPLSVDGMEWRPAYRISSVDPQELRAAEAELLGRALRSFVADLSGADAQQAVADLEPRHDQYQRLKQAFARYRDIYTQGGWPEVEITRELELGDRHASLGSLRERLLVEGFLLSQSEEEAYDEALQHAVERYQETHQLIVTGTTTEPTLRSLNKSVEHRLAEIAATMERWRSSPAIADHDAYRVEINIPDFHAELRDGDELLSRFRVVVGRASPSWSAQNMRTPIFSDEMERVVLNPYWNLPQSIIRNEVMPALEEDPKYLLTRNYEIVAQYGERVFMRQLPGPGNALGQVKFLFPNEYAVYMHDTPSRGLFGRNLRAYSHGCIRVEDPLDFAERLIARDRGWTGAETRRFMRRALAREGEETTVRLEHPFPVHVAYFVVRVDEENATHFLADIYGLDEERVAALESRASGWLPPQSA